MKKPSAEFYRKLDWSKSDAELSKQTRRPISTIYRWRIRLGHRRVHGAILRHKVLLKEAQRWGWNKGVSELARSTGYSREWLYQVGRKIGRKF